MTGGAGFLGTHLIENLVKKRNMEEKQIHVPRSREVDLRYYDNCIKVVQNIDIVIHLAARVGGIEYNRTHPGSLFYDNAKMGLNLMEAAREEGVEKFIGVSSVCAYPKNVTIPTKEEDLWEGYPEESNAAYGMAKKMLIIQTKAYEQEYGFNAISLILANLYGPGDNFEDEKSHVIPALIKRMIHAKKTGKPYITLWGTGNPTRDFLYVKDAVEGIIQATEKYDKPYPVNLASGKEISIKKLSEVLKEITEYNGELRWDTSKPDGQPRRLFSIKRAQTEFNFNPKTDLREGLRSTVDWYKENIQRLEV